MFKNLYECLERNDLIPVVANVIFFMIVQILFFKYVASKQLDEILLEKLDFVNELQKHSSYVKSLIQNYKEETLKKNKDAFLIQEKKIKKKIGNYLNSIYQLLL